MRIEFKKNHFLTVVFALLIVIFFHIFILFEFLHLLKPLKITRSNEKAISLNVRLIPSEVLTSPSISDIKTKVVSQANKKTNQIKIKIAFNQLKKNATQKKISLKKKPISNLVDSIERKESTDGKIDSRVQLDAIKSLEQVQYKKPSLIPSSKESISAEKNTKLGRQIAKTALNDCRQAYSGAGLLAIPTLIINTVTESGCRW